MQKFTIFTIIVSTLIIAIVAELVIQDYLQKLNNTGTLQANVFGSSYIAPYESEQQGPGQTESSEAIIELNKRLQEIASANPQPTLPSAETGAEQTEVYTPFSRVQTLLPALQIPGLSLVPAVYDQRLFQLIDTTPLRIQNANYAVLEVENGTIGSVYEFVFRTTVDAENAFDEIRILSNSFPNIDTNQTNQFGDRSYYINHLVKVGEVFLVVRKDNIVSAFAYKKDYHETFKTFFGVLY